MKKRPIPRALFEPLEAIQASDLEESVALIEMIRKETPLAIEEAFRGNKTFATLFEINNLGLYLDIPKQYWIPALEACIRFMIEKEEFLECVPLKNLIEEIKAPVKRVSKKKSNGATTERDTDGSK